MNKHHISTTISAKHWGLLKKYTEKFETQQKVLEFALENLENYPKQVQNLSPEEQLWMRIGRDMRKSISLVHRSIFEELLSTADYERVSQINSKLKPAEYLVVWYYQKPLKKCSLQEVIDGIISTARMGNWFESMNYKDEGSYYTLEVHHVLHMKGSKLFRVFFEDLFRAYGVKTESELSETGFFVKVFKKSQIE